MIYTLIIKYINIFRILVFCFCVIIHAENDPKAPNNTCLVPIDTFLIAEKRKIYLNTTLCIMKLEYGDEVTVDFCAPGLLPPHMMTASLDDNPITAITVSSACTRIKIPPNQTEDAELKIKFVEEKGCQRKGEKMCTLLVSGQYERELSKGPSIQMTTFMKFVITSVGMSMWAAYSKTFL